MCFRGANGTAIAFGRTYVYAARNAGFIKHRWFLHATAVLLVIRVSATSRRRLIRLFTGVAGRVIAGSNASRCFEFATSGGTSSRSACAPGHTFAQTPGELLVPTFASLVTVGEGYKRRIAATYPVSADKIDVVTSGVVLHATSFVRSSARRFERRTVGMTRLC